MRRSIAEKLASDTPRHGVVTLYGYGIHVGVDRGHLLVKDGIGADRRETRFPRVRHGLQRLIVIGSDGMVSLAALRWLADQGTAFVMLERDGTVLTTTGPVRPSDARLRRSQAMSGQSGIAVQIARGLIDKKLLGQERVVRYKLLATDCADSIARYREELANANSSERIRQVESQAAGAYWSAWRTLPIRFPRKDESRIPHHWRTFGTRVSPLTGSPRLAVNPANAILNYLYALLESESRLAASALGLDPGIGVLHVDTPARDSLACDLMEAVRPKIDGYLIDWVTREPLNREWFLEQRNGNCRLHASLAIRLSETAPTWGRAVAPFAEWLAQSLWSGRKSLQRDKILPTHLTQRNRTEARGAYAPTTNPIPKPARICRGCGSTLKSGRRDCASCSRAEATKNILEGAKRGRIAAQTPNAQAQRATTRRQQAAAIKAWHPSDLPDWLTEGVYLTKIQPELRNSTVSAIALALGVSLPYATDIRSGRTRPHPRHWQRLGKMTESASGR